MRFLKSRIERLEENCGSGDPLALVVMLPPGASEKEKDRLIRDAERDYPGRDPIIAVRFVRAVSHEH